MEMVTSATFPAREGDVLKERVMDERQLAALFRTNRELVQSKGEDNLSKNSKSLTSEEATHQAQFFVGEIFDARQRLRAIVATYSATIRKRWLKKTSEKRKALLLSAWPDIPEQHRPDIIYLPIIYLSSGDSTIRLTAAQEKAIIFPHINLEDLSTFRTFLLLLGSRTYYTPDVFASADLSSVRVGIQFNAIRSGSLFGHTMHLVGQTKREEYGRITSWTDNLESSYKWVTGTGTQVSHGLIILKIQANVLGFLLRSTELILHHVPMDSISISKNINLPFGSLSLQNGPDAGRSSHLQSLTEAPYEVPEQYEFGRLHGYINAKHNEMEDQMWSLREDPSCFLNLAWEESEHQHETTINNDWGQDPALQTQSFCERVFTGMISNLYRDVMLWNSVWRELQDLETLRQRYKSDIIPGQSLPTEYRQALSLFGSTLDRIVSMKRPEFQTAVQGCPGLRKYFSNVSDRGKGDSMRKGVKIDVDDHLWFLLWQLCYIENTEAWGYDNLLDEIERIIESDRKQSQRLSPRTKKLMSDLAIPAELQRQITLSFPGGQVVSALTVSDFKAKANEISKLINSMRKALQLEKGIGRFGLEMDAVCYPVDKKRTAETTAQMRSAEQHFDAFWSAVDEHVEPVTKERAVTIKNKVETRPVGGAAPGEPQIDLNAARPDDNDPAATITVSKRNHKAFSALFKLPDEKAATGELPWTDFLNAMASLGFEISKLDGSAWLFSPVEDNYQKSIVFHVPQPSSKIPFGVARRIGRRLTRAFGWTGETFVREIVGVFYPLCLTLIGDYEIQ